MSMTVKAAVAPGTGEPLVVQQLQLDDPRPDEVRVRMVASGVCHTDAIVRDGIYPTPLPAVLGHEGAGIVEAVGSAITTVEPGDHVALSVKVDSGEQRQSGLIVVDAQADAQSLTIVGAELNRLLERLSAPEGLLDGKRRKRGTFRFTPKVQLAVMAA
ncbi:hypothetical protein SUDANB66_06610 (plasmid) [Streptomyces sp. SudanB66_2053]